MLFSEGGEGIAGTKLGLSNNQSVRWEGDEPEIDEEVVPARLIEILKAMAVSSCDAACDGVHCDLIGAETDEWPVLLEGGVCC